MGRNVATVGFGALLVFGIIAGLASNPGRGGEIGAPPESLIQFDEQATAEFNEAAATRQNLNELLVVLLITLGLTGTIIVVVGRFDEAQNANS